MRLVETPEKSELLRLLSPYDLLATARLSEVQIGSAVKSAGGGPKQMAPISSESTVH